MLARVFHWMDQIINGVLASLMAVMLAVITAQVWYRFVVNDPLDWSEELGRYLFVWLSFLGAAAGVRYRVHLGIDLVQKLVGPTTYKIVVFIVQSIILVFLATITYWGWQILEVIQFQESPSLHVPMDWPYLAVPVGAVFMFINSVRVILEDCFGIVTHCEPAKVETD